MAGSSKVGCLPCSPCPCLVSWDRSASFFISSFLSPLFFLLSSVLPFLLLPRLGGPVCYTLFTPPPLTIQVVNELATFDPESVKPIRTEPVYFERVRSSSVSTSKVRPVKPALSCANVTSRMECSRLCAVFSIKMTTARRARAEEANEQVEEVRDFELPMSYTVEARCPVAVRCGPPWGSCALRCSATIALKGPHPPLCTGQRSAQGAATAITGAVKSAQPHDGTHPCQNHKGTQWIWLSPHWSHAQVRVEAWARLAGMEQRLPKGDAARCHSACCRLSAPPLFSFYPCLAALASRAAMGSASGILTLPGPQPRLACSPATAC